LALLQTPLIFFKALYTHLKFTQTSQISHHWLQLLVMDALSVQYLVHAFQPAAVIHIMIQQSACVLHAAAHALTVAETVQAVRFVQMRIAYLATLIVLFHVLNVKLDM
jgi:hypothetical protein